MCTLRRLSLTLQISVKFRHLILRQADSNLLERQSDEELLQLNPAKYKCMLLSRRSSVIYSYYVLRYDFIVYTPAMTLWEYACPSILQ